MKNVSSSLNPTVPQGVVDAPDLGYHNDVLDYCASGVSGTHTLAVGVAIGIYGPYGFQSGTLVGL